MKVAPGTSESRYSPRGTDTSVEQSAGIDESAGTGVGTVVAVGWVRLGAALGGTTFGFAAGGTVLGVEPGPATVGDGAGWVVTVVLDGAGVVPLVGGTVLVGTGPEPTVGGRGVAGRVVEVVVVVGVGLTTGGGVVDWSVFEEPLRGDAIAPGRAPIETTAPTTTPTSMTANSHRMGVVPSPSRRP